MQAEMEMLQVTFFHQNNNTMDNSNRAAIYAPTPSPKKDWLND